MTEEIKTLFNETIESQLTDIKKLKTGSNEKTTAIDDLAKIYRLYIDENKMMIDLEEKQARREMDDKHYEHDSYLKERQSDFDYEIRDREEMLKHSQLSEQKTDRIFRVCIASAELVVPLIFYGIWMYEGFKFEKTGVFGSQTFKGLFSRFKPTKK